MKKMAFGKIIPALGMIAVVPLLGSAGNRCGCEPYDFVFGPFYDNDPDAFSSIRFDPMFTSTGLNMYDISMTATDYLEGTQHVLKGTVNKDYSQDPPHFYVVFGMRNLNGRGNYVRYDFDFHTSVTELYPLKFTIIADSREYSTYTLTEDDNSVTGHTNYAEWTRETKSISYHTPTYEMPNLTDRSAAEENGRIPLEVFSLRYRNSYARNTLTEEEKEIGAQITIRGRHAQHFRNLGSFAGSTTVISMKLEISRGLVVLKPRDKWCYDEKTREMSTYTGALPAGKVATEDLYFPSSVREGYVDIDYSWGDPALNRGETIRAKTRTEVSGEPYFGKCGEAEYCVGVQI